MDKRIVNKWQCNSCKGTYADAAPGGGPYFHVCSPEVIEHATFDAGGNQLTPEKRTPRENIRNENFRTDVIEQDGKLYVQTGSFQDQAGPQRVEVASRLISEGAGRTLVA